MSVRLPPMVNVPPAPFALPGARMPSLATITLPPIVPVPPKTAPAATVVPLVAAVWFPFT
ncbi:hypothetical protein DP49_5684 [Burkholderia pseudomallei]|nr:hypothetical protein DP49_5684 [Burkholderia pseudomallei]